VKLPYMYVMDSIMKNSREPYVELFSHNLPAVFRDTYHACGAVAGLQPKLERLFATWHSQRVLRPPLLRVIEAQIPELRAPHLNPRFAPVSAPLANGCAQERERERDERTAGVQPDGLAVQAVYLLSSSRRTSAHQAHHKTPLHFGLRCVRIHPVWLCATAPDRCSVAASCAANAEERDD